MIRHNHTLAPVIFKNVVLQHFLTKPYSSTDTWTRAKSKVRSTVTVSWPGTLNACGEDVRRCDSFGMIMQTSMKQESNNYPGLDVRDCIGFEQRSNDIDEC